MFQSRNLLRQLPVLISSNLFGVSTLRFATKKKLKKLKLAAAKREKIDEKRKSKVSLQAPAEEKKTMEKNLPKNEKKISKAASVKEEPVPSTAPTKRKKKGAVVTDDESTLEVVTPKQTKKAKEKTPKIPKMPKTKKPKKLKNGALFEPDEALIAKLKDLKDETFSSTSSQMNTANPILASREAIRAVLTRNYELMDAVLADDKHVHNPFISRSVKCKYNALDLAVRANDVKMTEKLLNFLSNYDSRKSQASISNNLGKMSTGVGGVFAHKQTVGVSRGSKEGNNALTHDDEMYERLNTRHSFYSYVLSNAMAFPISKELLHLHAEKHHNGLACTDLYSAVSNGNINIASYLAETLEKQGGHGLNKLHVLVLKGTGEALPSFKTPSVTKKAYDRQLTPLHCAAINPNVMYLKKLCEQVGVEVEDSNGRKPFHFACAAESPEAVKYLLSQGANPNDKDKRGFTGIMIAAALGRVDTLKVIIEHMKLHAAESKENEAEQAEEVEQEPSKQKKVTTISYLDAKNTLRRTAAIHEAAYKGNAEAIKALVEGGADINLPASNKITPLMIASMRGNLDCVQTLIELGAKLGALDKTKKSCLIFAVQNGHFDVAKYLILKSFNPNHKDSSGNSVLHYAAAYGWLECVKLLVEAGADINAVNDWKCTPLVVAGLKSYNDCADWLLSNSSCDVNYRSSDGSSILHTFLENISADSLDTFKHIVEQRNADVTAVDSFGVSLFHILASRTSESNLIPVAEILMKRNAPFDMPDQQGNTPLMYAVGTQNLPMIQFLLKAGAAVKNVRFQQNILHSVLSKVMDNDFITTFRTVVSAICERPGGKNLLTELANSPDNQGRTPFLLAVQQFSGFSTIDLKLFDPEDEDSTIDPAKSTQTKASENTSTALFISFMNEYLQLTESTAHQTMVKVETKEQAPITQSIELNEEDGEADEEEEDDDEVIESSSSWFSFSALSAGTNALHMAVTKLNVELVQFFIAEFKKHNVSIDAPNEEGRTPLHLALLQCEKNPGAYGIAKLLIKNGASVSTLDKQKKSSLHMVLQSQQREYSWYGRNKAYDPIELVSDLCNIEGIDVNAKDAAGKTPLHYCCENGYSISAMYLLGRGADVEAKSTVGNTPLGLALYNDQSELAANLIRGGADVKQNIITQSQKSKKESSVPGYFGMGRVKSQQEESVTEIKSFFRVALEKKMNGLIYLLLDNGIELVDAVEDCIETDNHAIIPTLINKTSKEILGNVNAEGQNAFHVLARSKPNVWYPRIFKLLVQRGVNFLLQDNLKQTPLHVACAHDNRLMVDLLLKNNCDPNVQDSVLRTPLHYACMYNNPQVAEKLLSGVNKADVNMRDIKGKTPLFYAISPLASAAHANSSLAMMLPSRGADLNIKDEDGKTPLHYSYLQHSEKLATFLLQHGAQDPMGTIKEQALKERSNLIADELLEFSHLPSVIADFQEAKKRIDKSTPTTSTIKIPVDSQAEVSHAVVYEAEGIHYDILLQRTDISYGLYGANNFYKMQILHNQKQDLIVLFTKWGRVGEEGQFQHTPMPNASEAIAEFCKIFKSKTGNDWANRSAETFEPKPGKYKVVRVDYSSSTNVHDLLNPIDLSLSPPSSLPLQVQQLMMNFCDINLIKQSLHRSGLQMPLGRVSEPQLRDAMKVLHEIASIIKTMDENARSYDTNTRREHAEQLVKLSETFYSLVPNPRFSHSAVKSINSGQKVQKLMRELENLTDLQIAARVLIASTNKASEVNPIDYCYQSLETKITYIQPTEDEHHLINSYLKASYNKGKVGAVNVFKVERKGDAERFKPFAQDSNRMLLWHGSSVSNYISILKNGLLVSSVPEAEISGKMFGMGIYFADCFAKALPYAKAFDYGETACLLLCEVALGKVNEVTPEQYVTKPPTGSFSTKGLGGFVPLEDKHLVLPNGCVVPVGPLIETEKSRSQPEYFRPALHFNEYVVYNEHQVRIRYLVQVSLQ